MGNGGNNLTKATRREESIEGFLARVRKVDRAKRRHVFGTLFLVVLVGLSVWLYLGFGADGSSNPPWLEPLRVAVIGIATGWITTLITTEDSEKTFSGLNESIEAIICTKDNLTNRIQAIDSELSAFKDERQKLELVNEANGMRAFGIEKIGLRDEVFAGTDYWKGFLTGAMQTLVVSGRTLNKWLDPQEGLDDAFRDALRRICENGGRVTLVIYSETALKDSPDPDEELVERQALFEFLAGDDVLATACGEKGKGSLRVVEREALPYLFCENDGSILAAPYFEKSKNDDTLMYEVRKNSRLGRKYHSDVGYLCNSGKRIDAIALAQSAKPEGQ